LTGECRNNLKIFGAAVRFSSKFADRLELILYLMHGSLNESVTQGRL